MHILHICGIILFLKDGKFIYINCSLVFVSGCLVYTYQEKAYWKDILGCKF